jgi:hypothetical protein
VDLSHSEARCAYHINKSEIGFLVAKHAGFGTVDQRIPDSSRAASYSYNWKRSFTEPINLILSSSEVKKIIDNPPEPCINEYGRSYISEFFIFDSNIKSSLCV